MDEIKLNLDNLTEEERDQLMKLVEKENKKKRKVWKPDLNETYYAFESGNGIANYTWEDDDYDNSSYEIGNCYRATEDVKFAVEKRKVEVELQRFADENNKDGFDTLNSNKYFLAYSIDNKEIYIDNYRSTLFGDIIYFSSEEIANQAVGFIGENRIKKYIFGVN